MPAPPPNATVVAGTPILPQAVRPVVAPPAALAGTLVGHAPPSSEANTAPAGGASAERGTPQKTLIGIAYPGIAPLNAGHPAPAPPAASIAAPAPPGAPRPAPPANAAASAPQPAARPQARRASEAPRRIPVGAAIAIVAAAALFTAAVMALWLYDPRGPLTAEIKLDASGREQLLLTCAKCPDTSSVRLGEASAKFVEQRAELPLNSPLVIGDNPIVLELERTPGKRESVELVVPVEYRVRADTSPLDEAKPRVRVVVQAVPGTTAVVDGQPVALGPDGTGSAEFDVSAALLGEAETVERLERSIPYAITPPGRATETGRVSIELGIPALTIDAPGDSVIIDTETFVLAGRTLRGAKVSVEGRPIAVDELGKFAQMMNVSAHGETTITVRASAPNQAPRLVPVKVKRVADLKPELEKIRATAVSSYAEIASDPESKHGVTVALDGTVIEARAEHFASVLLLDVKSGCPKAPCFAKVTYGARVPFANGERVTAVGKVSGSVEGPRANTLVPAVAAEFVIRANQ